MTEEYFHNRYFLFYLMGLNLKKKNNLGDVKFKEKYIHIQLNCKHDKKILQFPEFFFYFQVVLNIKRQICMQDLNA